MLSSNKRYSALDGLRGYFVTLIFFVHYTGNFPGWGQPTAWGKFLKWLQNSHYGVFGFFILSGFLIGRMLFNNPRFSYKRFLIHRFLRIYPAFLASMLLSALVGIYYTHSMPWGWSPKIIAENLFFLNGFFALGEIKSYNFVSWSLFYEFLFYLTTPLIVLAANKLPNRFARLFFIYTCIFVITFGLSQCDEPVLGLAYILFFSGLVLASFSDSELKAFSSTIPEWLLLISYFAMTSVYSAYYLDRGFFTYAYGIIMGLIIVEAAFAQGAISKVFTWAPLRQLGRISYSFYLIHAAVIATYFHTLQTYLPRLNVGVFKIISLPIVFGLTVFVGYGLYFVTERFYFVFRVKQGKMRDLPQT